MRASVLECAGRALCAATALWLLRGEHFVRRDHPTSSPKSKAAWRSPSRFPPHSKTWRITATPDNNVCALASWSAPAERFARRRRFGCWVGHTSSDEIIQRRRPIQSGVALPESLPAALQNLADYRHPRQQLCALASWSAPAERFARRRRFGCCVGNTSSDEIIQRLAPNPKRRGAPRVASHRTPKPGGMRCFRPGRSKLDILSPAFTVSHRRLLIPLAL